MAIGGIAKCCLLYKYHVISFLPYNKQNFVFKFTSINKARVLKIIELTYTNTNISHTKLQTFLFFLPFLMHSHI